MLSVRGIVCSKVKSLMTDSKQTDYYVKGLKVTALNKDSSPASFPAININSLGEPQTADDLSGTHQNAILSTIEIMSYTANGVSEPNTVKYARDVLDKAGNIMISMGYSLIYGPEDVTANDKYNCVVARFRRLWGAGDIEKELKQ